MKYLLIIIPLFFFITPADAYQQKIMVQESQNQVFSIVDPEVETFFYGELLNFPHTYQFVVNKPTKLNIQIFELNSEKIQKIHSGIIVREREDGRGVDSIARLPAKGADSNLYFETQGGDKYITGPSFEKEIKPGVYRFEVSTPVNKGKYIFRIGVKGNSEYVGYFKQLKQIYLVKRFLNKSPSAMFASRFVYIPLMTVILLISSYLFYKRKYAS